MSDAGGTAKPLQRVDALRNRAKLLDAARQRLVDGDTILGLNTVARCAGVGIGTAYRHFPDRQSLVEGLAADALAALVADARRAAGDADPAAGLERLLRAALTAMADDPVLAEVLGAATPVCAETIGLSQDLGAAVGDLLSRARQVGAIGNDLGPDDLRRLLAGVHAATQAGANPAEARNRYLRVLLTGLRTTSTEQT